MKIGRVIGRVWATAKDETTDIVGALKLGANDYVTKPLDFPVVLARVRTQLSLKRAKDALNDANRRMKRDLEAAAKFQQSLLPTSKPDTARARFAWKYRPCDELAGDFLNFFALDDTNIAVFVVDVSGHGVASSLLSVTVGRLMTPQVSGTSLLVKPANPAGLANAEKALPTRPALAPPIATRLGSMPILRNCAPEVPTLFIIPRQGIATARVQTNTSATLSIFIIKPS